MRFYPLLIYIISYASSQASTGLYGFNRQNLFAYINTTSAAMTSISSPLPSGTIMLESVSTVDVQRGIYYAMGCELPGNITTLYGITIQDGNVHVRITLPFVQSQDVLGQGNIIAFDPKTSYVYVMGSMPTDIESTHTVLSVNPNTTEIKKSCSCTIIYFIDSFTNNI